MLPEFLHRGNANPAIVDAPTQTEISYDQLADEVGRAGEQLIALNPDRSLTFLYATNSVGSLVLYLAALDRRLPLCLVEPKEGNLRSLSGVYSPGLLLVPAGTALPDGFVPADATWRGYVGALPVGGGRSGSRTHEDLALLLQTSGTTGSPKLVRLTRGNVLANASSIAEYLALNGEEVSIQGLPMHYSYGLSLVNSHLLAGGTIVLTPHSFMMGEFWSDFDRHKCTSFAGIPFMYETLHRLGFDPGRRPTLRTMTQAGGGLRPDLIQHFYTLHQNSGRRFIVMYGQTEATARISYVPWEKLGNKLGSIGIAIPRGNLSLRQIEPDDPLQELVYRGPNVMLGYAERQEDLLLGDTLKGTLFTGDLARSDDEGFFYLTGRQKRIAKLFGKRINLGDVESFVEREFGCEAAVVEGENRLTVFVAGLNSMDPDVVRKGVAQFLGVGLMVIDVNGISSIPRTQSGKKEYKRLTPG